VCLEVKKTLPLQVDGEAGLQPPGIVTMMCLPEKAMMLSGGGDKLFSRQMSKKDTLKQLSLSKQLSETNITTTAVLSSRRSRTACTPNSPTNPVLREEDEEEQTAVNPES
jgi:hypothetical protein